MASESSPRIVQWLLDTRPLWPVPKLASSKDEVARLKTVVSSTRITAHNPILLIRTQASKALSFLTPSEQEKVLKYYHIKDAKTALASHLLKHLIITKYGGVPWSQSIVSRDGNGKPCFLPPADREEVHVEFNVSHQAGLVSLIAVVGRRGVNVGTDIVCCDERLQHDYRYIEKEGFFSWIDIYGDIFAESEISFMKIGELELDSKTLGMDLKGYGKDTISRCQKRNETLTIVAGEEKMRLNSNRVIDAKMRRFYAMWCLRESYVKMTGEALMAPWLKELEILSVKVPAPKEGLHSQNSLTEGEITSEFRINFKKTLVTNVRMELSALGNSYIVGGAMRVDAGVDATGLEMGRWTPLDIETDVLAFGGLIVL
jgi:4'-phosphopantetheinyl transferase